jgi:hypothetical protein
MVTRRDTRYRYLTLTMAWPVVLAGSERGTSAVVSTMFRAGVSRSKRTDYAPILTPYWRIMKPQHGTSVFADDIRIRILTGIATALWCDGAWRLETVQHSGKEGCRDSPGRSRGGCSGEVGIGYGVDDRDNPASTWSTRTVLATVPSP